MNKLQIDDFLKDHGVIDRKKIKNIIIPEQYMWCNSVDEYFFCSLHNLNNQPICNVCDKNVDFVSFKYGYRKSCSRKCAANSKERNDKIRKTMLREYGVENPLQSQKIRDKRKETNLKRYGVASPLQLEEVRNKCKEKYGGMGNASKIIKEKQRETLKKKYNIDDFTNLAQISEIKSKIAATNKELYGNETYFATEDSKIKRIKRLQEKYGEDVINPGQIPGIQDQIKETNLERFGKEWYTQTTEYLIKTQKTKMKNWGADHEMKNEKYFKEHARNSNFFKWKDYILPSSNVVKIQGYEDKALDILLNDYDESEILIHDVPVFDYIFENTPYKYYPDFYIPKDNLIIEVKSSYTVTLPKVLEKCESVEKSSYNFKLMVL